MYQYSNEKPNKALDILYANRIPKPKKKITAYQEQKKKIRTTTLSDQQQINNNNKKIRTTADQDPLADQED